MSCVNSHGLGETEKHTHARVPGRPLSAELGPVVDTPSLRAGFSVNHFKSILTPTQDLVYIGGRLRTDLGLALPTAKGGADLSGQVVQPCRDAPLRKQVVAVPWSPGGFNSHSIPSPTQDALIQLGWTSGSFR